MKIMKKDNFFKIVTFLTLIVTDNQGAIKLIINLEYYYKIKHI